MNYCSPSECCLHRPENVGPIPNHFISPASQSIIPPSQPEGKKFFSIEPTARMKTEAPHCAKRGLIINSLLSSPPIPLTAMSVVKRCYIVYSTHAEGEEKV